MDIYVVAILLFAGCALSAGFAYWIGYTRAGSEAYGIGHEDGVRSVARFESMVNGQSVHDEDSK